MRKRTNLDFKSQENEKKEEDGSTDKRPQRPEHQKDEAIEEYIDPEPEKGDKRNKEAPDQQGMGISEKTKKQPSDERDTANRK